MLNSFSIKHADEKTKSDVIRVLQITLIINFLPLIIGFISKAFTTPIWDASVNVFFSGELYFYAMSLCASIYITSQLSQDNGNTNMRLWSGVFVLCCAAFMAFFLGDGDVQNTSGVNATSDKPVPYNGLTFHGISSIGFLLLAVFLNYRVMVLAGDPPPNPEEVHRNKVEIMAEKVDPQYDQ